MVEKEVKQQKHESGEPKDSAATYRRQELKTALV